jgi:hypothetical protein
MRILPWHAAARDCRSARAFEGPLQQVAHGQQLALYYALVSSLAHGQSLDPLSAVRFLLRIALTVGDPLDLSGVCDAWVNLVDRLQRRDISEQTLEVARRLVCQAEMRKLPASVLLQIRQLREHVDRAWESERQALELEALANDLDARVARFDQMSSAEKAQLERDLNTGNQRARLGAQSLVDGSRSTRARRQRTPHRSGRRAPRRRTVRRAQTDSGGDGDDGPEPRSRRLACKGSRRLAHGLGGFEHSRGADV